MKKTVEHLGRNFSECNRAESIRFSRIHLQQTKDLKLTIFCLRVEMNFYQLSEPIPIPMNIESPSVPPFNVKEYVKASFLSREEANQLWKQYTAHYGVDAVAETVLCVLNIPQLKI